MSYLTERLNNKKRRITAAAILVFLIIMIVLLISFIKRGRNSLEYSWVKDTKYIIHALGGIDGYSYTNCREALENSYAKGCRVIEADMEYTSDGELVLIHNWKKKTLREIFGYETDKDEEPLSSAEFKELKIYGKYSTMTFKELMEFMKEHEDMLLVLDGKYTEEADVRKQYGDILRIAKECDDSIPDRLIPQIYNEKMYEVIKETYEWTSVIFTWYKLDEDRLDPEGIFKFCESNGIKVCTMEDSKENPLIDRTADRYGVSIYVHTINDKDTFDRLMESGVAGVYTDFLFEE